MEPILIVKSLSVGYNHEVVSSNISFSVAAGDYLCIIGENGAGKSTLLQTLLGLIPSLSGSIEYIIPRNTIGYLPQRTEVQKDFPASVEEIVLSGYQGRMGLRPFYNKAEKTGAIDSMTALGITELSNRCFAELSGGQQQRVLLARALCATQSLIFLDEPVAGLDPEATQEMYSAIQKLHERGIAIIMITHDVDEVIPFATHILRLGRTSFFGTKNAYARKQAMEFDR